MSSNAARALAAAAPPPTPRLVADDMPSHEVEEHLHAQTFRPLLDEDAYRARAFLRANVQRIADAKARLSAAANKIKIVEAEQMLASPQRSVEMRKYDARASAEYQAAVVEHAEATRDYELLERQYASAATDVEIWRTQSANLRGIKG